MKFITQLLHIVFAWMFISASERIFPKFQYTVNLEMYTDWWTILFFKPFHLMLSILCFLIAFLIIRYMTLKYLRFLLGKGSLLKRNRIESLALLLLCWWILAVTFIKQPVPTSVTLSIFILYDLVQWFFSNRRHKRLKTAFRDLR